MAPSRKHVATSAEVRRHLVRALRADLVGPFDLDDPASVEVWDLPPSKRYLTGFVVPRDHAAVEDDEDQDPTEDDLVEAGDDPGEESQNDRQARRRPLLPSSIGLSVLLPAGDGDAVSVRVQHADYRTEPQQSPVGPDGKKKRGRPAVRWRRVPRPPIELEVAAIAQLVARGLAQPGAGDDPSAQETIEAELCTLARRVVDRWSTFIAEARAGGAVRCYSPWDPGRTGTAMLWTALDEGRARDKGLATHDHFVAPTSMRDVEPTVHLWLRPAGWSSQGGRQ